MTGTAVESEAMAARYNPSHFMPTPLLRLARYRDIAREVAGRLTAARGNDPLHAWSEEVVVSSNSVGQAIASELVTRVPGGVAGLRLQTLETLSKRILNDAGEYPRVGSVAEPRLAMRTGVPAVHDARNRDSDGPSDHSRTASPGRAPMPEQSYRRLRDS